MKLSPCSFLRKTMTRTTAAQNYCSRGATSTGPATSSKFKVGALTVTNNSHPAGHMYVHMPTVYLLRRDSNCKPVPDAPPDLLGTWKRASSEMSPCANPSTPCVTNHSLTGLVR